MKIKEIKNWPYGIVDKTEPNSIPIGSFSKSLNFLTLGDHFELRRGSKILGADAGAGSVTGLHVGVKLDSSGTQIPFRTRVRKVEYYDSASEVWTEIGSNTLPAAASGEDVAFDSYNSQAGAQVFLSSKNSSIYKIMVANPGSITDLLSTVYRGFLRIKQNRAFLWNRQAASGSGAADEHNPYLSYIDNRQYTTVTSEAITDLASGTLAFKAGGAKRTCFGVKLTLTSSSEVFTDNREGTLTGSAGGTGTINYTSGAFTTSVTGAGTADYQHEDSTNQGLADFSFSGTRTAGQGNIFLQGDGGPLMGIETYGPKEYCAHKYKTWTIENTTTDTSATNLLFRDREGIPNWRAIKATSKGIFYVNAIDVENAKIKLMAIQEGSSEVEGTVISENIDLSPYRFNRAAIIEWLDYIIVFCRKKDSDSNDRAILYNKTWKSFDVVDYWGLVAHIYDGALLIGESITANVIEAFSGTDDSDSVIDGYAELNEWDLDYPGYLKVVKKIQIEGNIGPDQRFDVLASVDGGSFVRVGQISGAGSYVDRSQKVNIGSFTLGRGEIGGGSSDGGIPAYHYFRQLSFPVGRFERVTVRFERANDEDDEDFEGIGYFSVSTVRFYDIRLRSKKLPTKYR